MPNWLAGPPPRSGGTAGEEPVRSVWAARTQCDRCQITNRLRSTAMRPVPLRRRALRRLVRASISDHVNVGFALRMPVAALSTPAVPAATCNAACARLGACMCVCVRIMRYTVHHSNIMSARAYYYGISSKIWIRRRSAIVLNMYANDDVVIGYYRGGSREGGS